MTETKKKLAPRTRAKYLKRIAAIKDEEIDTSDIPELMEEQLRSGVRGLMYRPKPKGGAPLKVVS